MSQKSEVLEMFKNNGGKVTLAQFLNTKLAAEYRARITELRHDGYVITCHRGDRPSGNVYSLSDPKSIREDFCVNQ